MRLLLLLLALLMTEPGGRVTVKTRLVGYPGRDTRFSVHVLARTLFIIDSNLQFLCAQGEAVLLETSSHALPDGKTTRILLDDLAVELRPTIRPERYLSLLVRVDERHSTEMRVKSGDTFVIYGVGGGGPGWDRALLLTPELDP